MHTHKAAVNNRSENHKMRIMPSGMPHSTSLAVPWGAYAKTRPGVIWREIFGSIDSILKGTCGQLF